MRGHHPGGWAATLLIAVAYAHVLELAGAVLAVVVAVRPLLAPAGDLVRAHHCAQLGQRPWPVAPVIERRPAREPDRQPTRSAS